MKKVTFFIAWLIAGLLSLVVVFLAVVFAAISQACEWVSLNLVVVYEMYIMAPLDKLSKWANWHSKKGDVRDTSL